MLTHMFTMSLAPSVEMFHLVFIAIDRYEAVYNLLRYSTKITIPIAWLMVFASWAILHCTPMAYYLKRQMYVTWINSLHRLGSRNILFNTLWGSIDTLIAFFFPCSIMGSLYTRTLLVAK